MKLKLLTALLFLACISCKSEDQKVNEDSDFVRTWFDTVKMTPFESKLIINENKTFDYSGGACTSSFYSKGNWKIEKDTLILVSLKTDKCHWKENFGLLCFTNDEIDKMNEDNKTIKNCEPTGEISYIHFNNEKFYIRNDTLIHTGKNKNCPKLRIAFSKDIKTK